MLSMSNFAVALPCHTFSSLGYYQSCIGSGTSILLNDRGIEVCFPGRLRDLSLLLNVQTGSVSARVPVSCAPVEWRRRAGTGRFFQGVKRPEHEAEYSPLCGTELKHRWSFFNFFKLYTNFTCFAYSVFVTANKIFLMLKICNYFILLKQLSNG
jgi:hypothetical protein